LPVEARYERTLFLSLPPVLIVEASSELLIVVQPLRLFLPPILCLIWTGRVFFEVPIRTTDFGIVLPFRFKLW